MVGAPKGNQNAAKGKIMSMKLRKRLEEREAIEKIADALITKAEGGDLPSIKEVFDRVDGKAPQETSIEFNDQTEYSERPELDVANRLAFILRRGLEARDSENGDRGDTDMGSSTGPAGDGVLH